MSRIIDADALKDRLQEALEFQEKHDNYEGAELFEIAQDFVDEQPTIDAIPVEWLKGLMLSTDDDVDKVEFAWIMREWKNEQGAR